MKKRILLGVLLTSLLAGCATTNKDTESSARWKNAGIGAAIGCVVTGPFCLLPVGPMIGAIIGGVVSIDGEKETKITTAELKPEAPVNDAEITTGFLGQRRDGP